MAISALRVFESPHYKIRRSIITMKSNQTRLPLLATLTLILSLAAACTSQSGQSTGPASEGADSAAGGSTPATAKSKEIAYPLQTDKTLTYWGELPTSLTGVKSSHSDVPFFQELQKQTGVSIKFTNPPTGQGSEALNVMLASGELPDVIEYDWLNKFPGGPEKAIKDGFILRLNDVLEQHAPNLMKYLREHPEIDKMVKTDNGSYYVFPFVRGADSLLVWHGPVIRKDWLDELGLSVPETIDEWHTALTAFKKQKGAVAPLSLKGTPRPLVEFSNGAFVGAFGVTKDFFIDKDGGIKFGPMEKGYKEFLATFRKWYEEGLLDSNIAMVDSKALDANIASGATGATLGSAGGGMGKWIPLIAEKNQSAKMVAAPYPVMKKGDTPMFSLKDPAYSSNGSVAITANSKNVELAAQMLDYGYSPEGHMLFNFGTEGLTYKMENSFPKYTDLVLKNPNKLAPAQAMSLYIRGNTNGPFEQDERYIQQYYALEEQREAIKVWSKTDVDKHKLPPVTATPEESSELAKIMTDVETLVDEMTLKIILGVEPVDSFEGYTEKFKSLKIDRAIEIKQASLSRYIAR
jgi:putative aldouronate transport system substrate-binding protein